MANDFRELNMAKIDAFFKLMHEQNASDLHLMAGQPPALRVHGDIERVKYKVLGNDELRAMLYEIAVEEKVKLFEETGDVDFGYEIPGWPVTAPIFLCRKMAWRLFSGKFQMRS
jgi:Tfp pilus assembly pilus retraction ATPase PilT